MDNIGKAVIVGLGLLVLSKVESRGVSAAVLPPAHDPGQPEPDYGTPEITPPVDQGPGPDRWGPEGQTLVWDPDATLDANGYPTNGAGAWVVPGRRSPGQPEPDVPPAGSPLDAIARGYVYDPAQGAFVPPTSQPRNPLDIVGQVFYDPTVGNWYTASPYTGRELGWDRQPNMIPVAALGAYPKIGG